MYSCSKFADYVVCKNIYTITMLGRKTYKLGKMVKHKNNLKNKKEKESHKCFIKQI